MMIYLELLLIPLLHRRHQCQVLLQRQYPFVIPMVVPDLKIATVKACYQFFTIWSFVWPDICTSCLNPWC